MSFTPFIIGLTTSAALTFSISEGLADRRCMGMEKVDRNEFIRAQYSVVHNQLINDEFRNLIRDDPDKEVIRKYLVSYVVNPIRDAANSTVHIKNDVVEKVKKMVDELK